MVTLQEIAKALNLDPKNTKQDFSTYGEVKSINPDKTYQVSLNGSDTTVKCARLTGAKVGDVVLVTVLKNGYAVVTGCVGGDTDAADAKQEASDAYIMAEGGITTDTLHYLATNLSTGVTVNTPGWTTTVQSITQAAPYLWTYHTYHKASGTSTNTEPVITGVYGDTGTDGAKWYTGTGITGTSTTATVFPSSGVSSAVVGDMYLNTDTNNTYRCTTAGAPSVAKWVYADNIQGDPGSPGSPGSPGVSVTAVQPQYYLSTSTSSATGGSWSNTLTYVTGKYIWTRDQITYSNSTTGYSTEIYNEALTTACSNAEDALTVAEGVNEHFWYDNTGAHVTEDTQEDYEQDPANAGGNTLITSQGVAIRKGTKELAAMSRDGLDIKSYDNNNTAVPIAHLGYGAGKGSQGSTEDAPYYDLGTRTLNSEKGNYSTIEGVDNTASRYCAHAEGVHSIASGSEAHAEGTAEASGSWAHAEGGFVTNFSVIQRTTASGTSAHAEGQKTTASGNAAHAEGLETTASGNYTHAGGKYTNAGYEGQTVIGEYNDNKSADLFEVGNGTANNARKNAFEVDDSGNANITGTYRKNGTEIPYITEKGSKTGGWHYEKWSTGKIEAWGSISTGTLSSLSGGNRVYMATGVNGAIPSGIFSSTPTFIQAFCQYSSAACYSVWATPTSSTAFKMQIVKNANNTTSVDVQIHAVYYPSSY